MSTGPEVNRTPLTERERRRRVNVAGKRQEIVNQAAELFDRDGFQKTSMEDIALAVGLAKPSLYHYFSSRNDILFAIHEEFIDLLLNRHRSRAQTSGDPQDLLREAMADILELMQTHRGHVRVYFEHYRELPAGQQALIATRRDEYEHAVTGIVARGRDEAVFRDVDAGMAALALFGMCNWAYQWYRPAGRLTTEQVADIFYSFLTQGIGARQTESST